ncbi:hypothetical protein C8Q78DRAFT_1083010 [Trametes maxima]|nr:hypothetical protein C8Q78DRAFT_1083010 [Trametes maxima]
MSDFSYNTDLAVASLLYALSLFVPGIVISPEDFDWLRQYLGEEGETVAFYAYLDIFGNHFIPHLFPAADPAGPVPPASIPLPVPSSASTSGARIASSPPPIPDASAHAPPPVFRDTQAASIPVPSSSSMRSQPSAAAPAPSSKALGKRKARPASETPAPEAGPSTKRARKNVPRKDGEATCLWDGCGAAVPCSEWDRHLQRSHFGGETPHGSTRKGIKCEWAGCTAQGKNKEYPGCFSDLTALFQHIRRNHFKVIDVECPWPGCNHKPARRDCMSRPDGHIARCKFNPNNKKPDAGEEVHQ